ncbi:MAG: hypothetical protein ABI442_08165 [Gemmatimonadaceae bacterium]
MVRVQTPSSLSPTSVGTRADSTFDDACELLEDALGGHTRGAILDAAGRLGGFRAALGRLRAGMQSHTFATSVAPLALDRVLRQLDARTRAEGFHVLQAWDYRAHRFLDHTAPALMLERVAIRRAPGVDECDVLAALLDHYFLWILALLAVRAWDRGDPNANLDCVTRLANLLNGPQGSGHAFVETGELLLLLAISQYHPTEPAYDLLLHRVESLDAVHRRRMALVVAPVFASHLRWGFRFMYQRDPARMRADNAVDYPWVMFAVETLLDAYDCAKGAAGDKSDLDHVTEGLIDVISVDPSAFVDSIPDCLRGHEASHAKVRERLAGRRHELCAEWETRRPDQKWYSPIGFEVNFLNNVIVAMVETLAGLTEPHVSLDALCRRQAAGCDGPSALRLARVLTRYGGVTADAVGGHALVLYDGHHGSACFNAALEVLRA